MSSELRVKRSQRHDQQCNAMQRKSCTLLLNWRFQSWRPLILRIQTRSERTGADSVDNPASQFHLI